MEKEMEWGVFINNWWKSRKSKRFSLKKNLQVVELINVEIRAGHSWEDLWWLTYNSWWSFLSLQEDLMLKSLEGTYCLDSQLLSGFIQAGNCPRFKIGTNGPVKPWKWLFKQTYRVPDIGHTVYTRRKLSLLTIMCKNGFKKKRIPQLDLITITVWKPFGSCILKQASAGPLSAVSDLIKNSMHHHPTRSWALLQSFPGLCDIQTGCVRLWDHKFLRL